MTGEFFVWRRDAAGASRHRADCRGRDDGRQMHNRRRILRDGLREEALKRSGEHRRTRRRRCGQCVHVGEDEPLAPGREQAHHALAEEARRAGDGDRHAAVDGDRNAEALSLS